MGCGCKGTQNQTPEQQAVQIQQAQAVKQQQTESVKAAIKKTVEKYYKVNKTSN
jgi:hypothetical protein